jgi:hypothetical protein
LTRRPTARERELTWPGSDYRLRRSPAIERTRIAPGTLVPTELARTVRLDLAEGRCPAADVRAIDGTVWADATSAWETEASSAPIRFSYAR